MIKYGSPEDVEQYFDSSARNQSLLKDIIKGVGKMRTDERKMYYEEKGHFLIGSAVDVWLTQGKQNFDKQYFTFTGEKPSDTVMSIVKRVFDGNIYDGVIPDANLHEYASQVLDSIDFHKYQTRWKEETRINKIMELGFEYYEQLKDAHGKQILSETEVGLVQAIVMSFQTGKYTAKYFQDQRDIEMYHQVPIYFNYEDTECKVLIDKLIIDREKKTIQPIDIKTIGRLTTDFPYAVKSLRYDFQAAFYTEALAKFIDGEGMCGTDLGDCRDFTILPFLFLVETTSFDTNKLTGETTYHTGKALVFEMSYAQIQLGKYGRPELFTEALDANNVVYITTTKPILGFTQAMVLYDWYEKHGFEYDKGVIENNGVILIE